MNKSSLSQFLNSPLNQHLPPWAVQGFRKLVRPFCLIVLFSASSQVGLKCEHLAGRL